MTNENLKIALLIDADNVPPKYIKTILDELAQLGMTTYRRIYGDWSSTRTTKWKNVLMEYGLTAVQQFPYTVGKNATDSAMIIDAMEMLYRNDYIDAFCLATSDSDFTSIATKLREAGKTIIGMGEQRTPEAFVKACNEFKYIDVIFDDDSTAVNEDKTENEDDKSERSEKDELAERIKQFESSITNKKNIADTIENAINSNNGETFTSYLKTILKNKYPDFDERNYGYSKFSRFINDFDIFETYDKDTKVKIKDSSVDKKKIVEFINSMRTTKPKTVNIGIIRNDIVKKFPNFKVKDYGYSTMKKFLQSINGITIEDSNAVLEKKSAK